MTTPPLKASEPAPKASEPEKAEIIKVRTLEKATVISDPGQNVLTVSRGSAPSKLTCKDGTELKLSFEQLDAILATLGTAVAKPAPLGSDVRNYPLMPGLLSKHCPAR